MKLNQVVAVEKGIKSRSHKALTDMYKMLPKKALFEGLVRTYEKKEDDGEQLPPESTRVQNSATDLVRNVEALLTELFDTVATKDTGNCKAKANVVVDGEVLLTGIPATTLLFLEKQLIELHAFIGATPVLDPAYEWELDANDGLRKTKPISTTKTKKVKKALVLHPPTIEHPAQTDTIEEIVVVGHWNQVRMSGALPATRQKEFLGRVERLQKAVKFAREEANSTEVNEVKIGEKFFSWLFA